MRKFVSLGGFCGTAMALRENELYDEAYPFDHIRSLFEGIIDCIDNDFSNFFPKKIEKEFTTIRRCKIYNTNGKIVSYRGRYFSFHHHDLDDNTIKKTFLRRFKRFNNLLSSNNEIIFLRTTITYKSNDEIKMYDKFHKAISLKYPNLKYILIFIIPHQNQTGYYKNIDQKTFIFSLKLPFLHTNFTELGEDYRTIYNFLKNNNLFEKIPEKNENLEIINETKYWWLSYNKIPFFRYDN